jgi:hypothetical protein
MALRSFRVFFGLLLVTTAIGKLLDNRGFAAVIQTYQVGIPEGVLLPLGLAISFSELGLALMIYEGRFMVRAAQLAIVMHAGYAGMAVLTNLRGIRLENCGCFGVFLARPMTWGTVVEDVILTLLAGGFYYAAVRAIPPAQAGRAATAAS